MTVNCFYHPERLATGVCNICNKPICGQCLKQFINKPFCDKCKSKLTERMAEYYEQQKVGKRLDGKMVYFIAPVSAMTGGLIFIGLGIRFQLSLVNFFSIIGLIMLGIGILWFIPAYLDYKKHGVKLNTRKKRGLVCIGSAIIFWVLYITLGWDNNFGMLLVLLINAIPIILMIVGLMVFSDNKIKHV